MVCGRWGGGAVAATCMRTRAEVTRPWKRADLEGREATGARSTWLPVKGGGHPLPAPRPHSRPMIPAGFGGQPVWEETWDRTCDTV